MKEALVARRIVDEFIENSQYLGSDFDADKLTAMVKKRIDMGWTVGELKAALPNVLVYNDKGLDLNLRKIRLNVVQPSEQRHKHPAAYVPEALDPPTPDEIARAKERINQMRLDLRGGSAATTGIQRQRERLEQSTRDAMSHPPGPAIPPLSGPAPHKPHTPEEPS